MIKEQLDHEIGQRVLFSEAAYRTQRIMHNEGQEVSLHASFVCLLHLANE
jgi:hypothetical protein